MGNYNPARCFFVFIGKSSPEKWPQDSGEWQRIDWCFGTWMDYFSHHIENVIIPTGFNSIIFQRGRWLNHQPDSLPRCIHVYPCLWLQGRRACVKIHVVPVWIPWFAHSFSFMLGCFSVDLLEIKTDLKKNSLPVPSSSIISHQFPSSHWWRPQVFAVARAVLNPQIFKSRRATRASLVAMQSISKSLHVSSAEEVTKALAELPAEDRAKLQQALHLMLGWTKIVKDAVLEHPILSILMSDTVWLGLWITQLSQLWGTNLAFQIIWEFHFGPGHLLWSH